MNKIFLALLSVACLARPAAASGDDDDAGSAAENERVYAAGAGQREAMIKEADTYARTEEKRAKPESAFASSTPEGLMNPGIYAELREKNAGFLRNVAYWQEQIRSMHPNLVYAVKVNDLETAGAILKHMRDDHYAIDNEVSAIEENNRKARAWPRLPTNQEEYEAGAAERASILAQAEAAADMQGREVPVNAFAGAAPAQADKARYEALRGKNAAYIGNIQYWRNQLTANHENLKAAVEANDLETARTLLDYMKKDSASLTNEIKAVEVNNAEAAGQ